MWGKHKNYVTTDSHVNAIVLSSMQYNAWYAQVGSGMQDAGGIKW